MERRLAAILAADVVGYSRLMGDDEEGTQPVSVSGLDSANSRTARGTATVRHIRRQRP